MGIIESKSNVQRLLDAEVKEPIGKVERTLPPYTGPSAADCLQTGMFVVSKADRVRASQSCIVDQETLARLFREAGVRTDEAMVKTATDSFVSISKGRDSVPMNQCEVVLERIGVKKVYQRMKIFDAFDGDGDKIMEYREFIWGLSLLITGSLVQRFQLHWDSMARLREFSHLSLQGGGTLKPEEVGALIAKNGHVHDEALLEAMGKETMRRVGFTGGKGKDGGFVWESFQDAVISDTNVQTIMEACITGEEKALLKARVLLSVPLQDQIDAKRGVRSWVGAEPRAAGAEPVDGHGASGAAGDGDPG